MRLLSQSAFAGYGLERRKISNTLRQGNESLPCGKSISQQNFQLFFKQARESIVEAKTFGLRSHFVGHRHNINAVARLQGAAFKDLAQHELQSHQILFAHVRGHKNGFLQPTAAVFFEGFGCAVA